MKKGALNGSFKKPTGSFTQISNTILQDRNLSLKAKGLFSLIACYITLPNFTLYKNFIKSNCSEGKSAFDSAWKELTAAGYLVHSRNRQQDGTFSYEYTLCVPNGVSAHCVENAKEVQPEKLSNNIENSVTENPVTENHPPVSYMYNKTLKNNILSNNQRLFDDTKIYKKISAQINYQEIICCLQDKPNEKAMASTLLNFLVELSNDQRYANYTDQIDECFILEFITFTKHLDFSVVTYPIPYLKKTFLNYIKESVTVLSTM